MQLKLGSLCRILLFSFFASLFLTLGLAEAANVFIKKPKVRAIIPPGGAKSGLIELENPSPEPLSIKVYLEDWVYGPLHDGTKEFSPPGTTPLSCTDWISFSPAEFVIPPFGRQNISYMIRVPPEAKGGHYATLFCENVLGSPDLQTGIGMNIVIRVASLFYIEPEGTIKRQGEISNLSLTRGSQDSALTIDLGFKNTGNVDITVSGSYHIIDDQGMVLARGEFNNVYTFPQDTAKLATTWKEPLPKGVYDLVLTLDIGKALEEAGLGRGPVITKEAEIEIGKSQEVIKVTALK
jgi:P pilus assembly chaperone PapD